MAQTGPAACARCGHSGHGYAERMKLHHLAAVIALAVTAASSYGQVSGKTNGQNCIDLATDPNVIAQGRLTLRHYPGPPNYQSIKNDDADETAFILELPAPVCVSDGDQGFADPSRQFLDLHIYTDDTEVAVQLQASVGKLVTVYGNGFAAENGHHHAPLVIRARSVQLRGQVN